MKAQFIHFVRKSMIRNSIWTMVVIFLSQLLLTPYAAAAGLDFLPAVGQRLAVSPAFSPVLLTGVKLYKDDPLRFDFIINPGNENLSDQKMREQTSKLIKYFLCSLTVPEQDLWVNLSPYEKDRIIPDKFGVTEMGRDLLAQDYILKQISASIIYPENALGKKFWDRVRQKSKESYGADDIPMNSLNKVWIVPQKAVVLEHGDVGVVSETRLKVMLEEDYQALGSQRATGPDARAPATAQNTNTKTSVTPIIREILIPELEKEVNEGKNFAPLRQIFNSMVLAAWMKRVLRNTVYNKIYIGQNKVDGVDVDDKLVREKIYQQYLEAFKKGVYNYIKEERDPATDEMVPRKYFSGGMDVTHLDPKVEVRAAGSSVIAKTLRRNTMIAAIALAQLFGGTVQAISVITAPGQTEPAPAVKIPPQPPATNAPKLKLADAVKSERIKDFLIGDWTKFVKDVGNGKTITEAQRKVIIDQAYKIDAETGNMISDAVNAIDNLSDQSTYNRILRQWARFNFDKLLPLNIYGHMEHKNFGVHTYYFTFFSLDDKPQQDFVNKKDKIYLAEGRPVGGNHSLGAEAISPDEGDDVLLIDTYAVHVKVNQIMNIVKGIDPVSKTPGIGDWFIKQYGSMNYNQITFAVKNSLKAHEYTHKAMEKAGIRYALSDHFNIPQNIWDQLFPWEKSLIEKETAAYLAGAAQESTPGYTLNHLYNVFLKGYDARRDWANTLVARYVLHTIAIEFGLYSLANWPSVIENTNVWFQSILNLSSRRDYRDRVKNILNRGYPGLDLPKVSFNWQNLPESNRLAEYKPSSIATYISTPKNVGGIDISQTDAALTVSGQGIKFEDTEKLRTLENVPIRGFDFHILSLTPLSAESLPQFLK